MTNSIQLPPFLTTRSPSDIVSICREIIVLEGKIQIDASQLRFVDPFGMTLLGATLHEKKNQGTEISLSGLNTNAGQYLKRMDVFNGVQVEDSGVKQQRHNRTDSLVELTSLNHADDVAQAAKKLSYAVVGAFGGIDPDENPDEMTGYTTIERLVEPLQYVLSELLENALTHARRKGYQNARVWVAAQYFPSSELVKLSVVDNGCGFLNSLQHHSDLNSNSHLAAILLALRPRISCNRDLGIFGDSVNQGVGLTTAQRIVEQTHGKMVIVSGSSSHDTTGESQSWDHNKGWQGVAIGIEMRRDQLQGVRFRELLPDLNETSLPPLRFE